MLSIGPEPALRPERAGSDGRSGRRQEEKTQEARRKMEISEETMALMSMATSTVAVSRGKYDEMEGISKK